MSLADDMMDDIRAGRKSGVDFWEGDEPTQRAVYVPPSDDVPQRTAPPGMGKVTFAQLADSAQLAMGTLSAPKPLPYLGRRSYATIGQLVEAIRRVLEGRPDQVLVSGAMLEEIANRLEAYAPKPAQSNYDALDCPDCQCLKDGEE